MQMGMGICTNLREVIQDSDERIAIPKPSCHTSRLTYNIKTTYFWSSLISGFRPKHDTLYRFPLL